MDWDAQAHQGSWGRATGASGGGLRHLRVGRLPQVKLSTHTRQSRSLRKLPDSHAVREEPQQRFAARQSSFTSAPTTSSRRGEPVIHLGGGAFEQSYHRLAEPPEDLEEQNLNLAALRHCTRVIPTRGRHMPRPVRGHHCWLGTPRSARPYSFSRTAGIVLPKPAYTPSILTHAVSEFRAHLRESLGPRQRSP